MASTRPAIIRFLSQLFRESFPTSLASKRRRRSRHAPPGGRRRCDSEKDVLMGRPVRIAAPARSEADILKDILDFKLLNVEKWRNTRGRFKDVRGQWITFGVGPNGASDIVGYRAIRITPEMVGSRLAQFVAIEVKDGKASVPDEQRFYIDGINAAGGCAGVCRSVQDAAALLLDLEKLKRKLAA
jgi:hypothetical protein